jgi:hypothetical protein
MGIHLDITREQLQAAWLQRRRSHWPATFTEVMADPMLRRLVRAAAVGQAQAARRRSSLPLPHLPTRLTGQRPQGPTTRVTPQPAARPAPFDARRAAANDLDDKDE